MSEPPEPTPPRAQGMRAIAADEFSVRDAIGGWRGVVESVAPGLVFVVVFVLGGRRVVPAAIAAGAVALVAVGVRLVQRTPVTQAVSGLLGVGIGVVWALVTGRAQNYFAWGLWTNVAYFIATVVTILVGWPLVGVLAGLFEHEGPLSGGAWAMVGAFRSDPVRRRRAVWATWIWVAVFGARLAVQLPLYFSAQVGWLGTAKIVMGVPLFALAMWISWLLLRPARAPEPARPRPDR